MTRTAPFMTCTGPVLPSRPALKRDEVYGRRVRRVRPDEDGDLGPPARHAATEAAEAAESEEDL